MEHCPLAESFELHQVLQGLSSKPSSYAPFPAYHSETVFYSVSSWQLGEKGWNLLGYGRSKYLIHNYRSEVRDFGVCPILNCITMSLTLEFNPHSPSQIGDIFFLPTSFIVTSLLLRALCSLTLLLQLFNTIVVQLFRLLIR